MLATLLILLPTAYSLVISNSDLADNILSKQEECVNIKNRVDNIVDEEDEEFDKYNKCKEDLDRLKLEYITKTLLGPSYYTEVFPVRLSNGTLIMVPVPSKTESPNIPNTPPCSSCEGLCMVSEKCLTLLEEVNKNTDPSEISYYKIKHKNCMELLKEQKLKFIRELNLSEDVLRGDGKLSVDCKKGTVLMTLPDSEKSSDEGSSNSYPSVAENEKTEKEHDAHLDGISPSKNQKNGNKYSEEVNINSIPKKNHAKKSLKTKSIGKFNMEDESFKVNYDNSKTSDGLQSNHRKPDKNLIYPSNDEGSKPPHQFTKQHETIAIPPLIYKDDTSDKGLNNEIPNNNDYIDETPEKLVLGTTRQNSEKIDNTALNYNEILPPHNKMGITKDPIPPKDQLGDEIIKIESDCEDILREVNKELDHRTVASLQYYDKKYAECITYLNLYKRKYAKRHGLKFKSYKSMFPIVLSSGVEKLVTLPEKIPDLYQQTEKLLSNKRPSMDELSLQPPDDGIATSGIEKPVTLQEKIPDLSGQTENSPPNQSPSIDELSLQPPDEGIDTSGIENSVTLPDKIHDLSGQTENSPSNQSPSIDELSLQPPDEAITESHDEDAGDDGSRFYDEGKNIKGFPIQKAELIISERFYESDVEENISTLIKFAKLIRMYTGNSDRMDC